MKIRSALFFFLLALSCCTYNGEHPVTVPQGAITASGPSGPAGPGSGGSRLLQPGKAEPGSHKIHRKKKRKKPAPAADAAWTQDSSHVATDSLFISRLNLLRSGRIEPDLNEPLSRRFFTSPGESHQLPGLITVGRETYLVINFDNDILDYTDRFYTNGIRIELITPGLQANPVGKLLIPYWSGGRNYYGIAVVQNMYTPSTTKLGGILYGDRPYAAYLYLGSFKITLDPVHRYRQSSEIDVGIIGPNSYGEWVQRSFHNAVPTNNEPLGWEYQVKNDLVLDYSFKMEKGLADHKNICLVLFSKGELGTLYTNLSGGAMFRTGWMNPYFANLGTARGATLKKQGLRKFQCFLFLKGTGKMVGYDATLQGGMLNRSSTYILPSSAISRVVFETSGGVTVTYSGLRLDLEQYLLSPEFHQGLWHKWVHLSLSFCL